MNKAEIKRRLSSVRQTRQITGAMETISVSKMRKAFERFDVNNSYFTMLSAIAKAVAGSSQSDYFKKPDIDKKMVIVLASDKGLCGAFNHDVFKFADSVIDSDTVVMPVGSMAYEHYRASCEIDDGFIGMAYEPDYKQSQKIAAAITEGFGKKYGQIAIVYTHLASHAVWAPKLLNLLPIERDKMGGGFFETDSDQTFSEFEPNAKEVMKTLIPMYLGGLIYGALVHSSAAEHSARRAAMSASTKNADAMILELSMEYNRERQGQVTEQITEIIGSRQAIE